jgi:RNA polymerase sigma-70 factor (ECF subfamily)
MRIAEVGLSEAIDKARSGNPTGFEALYHEYKQAVYALCLRKTSNVEDAKDLTQEVFLKVYRKVKTLRNEAAFKSWLFKVTMNTILMYFRKRKMECIPLDHLTDSETSPFLAVLEALTSVRPEPIARIALSRAIGGLPRSRRAVVVLHDIKGMSYPDIASSLGVSVSTAKSNLWRAHRQLRGILPNRSHN